MERIGIVSSYTVLFAVCVGVIFILLDGYECYVRGKFDGKLQMVNIDLMSLGDIDLTMDLTADVWLQSRLHTLKIDVAGCKMKMDMPSGRHLELVQATNTLPLRIKPKSLWSAWDGSFEDGNENPTYSVESTIAFSHVNFTSMGTTLVDAMVAPSTGAPHTLHLECVIDGAVELFSVPTMSVPLTKYVYTTRKDFYTDSPTTDSTNVATTTSDHRSLTIITDIASQLKSILSSIPAIGSSLAMVSQSDYESLVNDVASSPSNLLGLLLYPFTDGIQTTQSSINDKYNVASLNLDYDLHLPTQYVPSFLMNVYVPPLAVRISSGTYGSEWSWLVSTQSFNLDFSKTTTVDTTIHCGNEVGNCTLMTPVFGFISNAFANLKDTIEFDMMGDDNVVYRALGRHTNISYSALLNYQIPSPNFLVNDLGITSCLNVTVGNRWEVKNACLMKQPRQPEVDVSFDIPSFDGTSGSYLGMSSAFTWTYAAVSNNPTTIPTSLSPSLSPTMIPTQPTIAPTFAPTIIPTLAPTNVPTATPSLVPTSTPTIAHKVALLVTQVHLLS